MPRTVGQVQFAPPLPHSQATDTPGACLLGMQGGSQEGCPSHAHTWSFWLDGAYVNSTHAPRTKAGQWASKNNALSTGKPQQCEEARNNCEQIISTTRSAIKETTMVSLFSNGSNSQPLPSVPSATPSSGPHCFMPTWLPEPPNRSVCLDVFSPFHPVLYRRDDSPKTQMRYLSSA